MLGEGPIGNCIGEVFRVADCSRHIDPQGRMMTADGVEQPGQISLQVPTLGKEQRDDRDLSNAPGGQAGNGRGEVRLHQLQERQLHANARLLLAQPCHDPVKRLRP